MSEFENQLDRRYMGPSASNSFVMHDSSSRIAMYCKQLGQHVVVAKPDKNRVRSGMEEEYGKYTIATTMPEDGVVRAIIDRTVQTPVGGKSIEKIVLVEIMGVCPETGRIVTSLDMIEISNYHTMHGNWGFLTKPGPAMGKLYEGSPIRKGEVFNDTPAKTPDGYRQGVELNIALVSDDIGIEDGFGIREGVLSKLTTKGIGSRSESSGNGRYFLNTYGDENNFRAFPTVGEYIRDDGIVFAMRTHDPVLSPTQLTTKSLMTVDKLFDDPVYGEPGARVIDVRVYKGDESRSLLPSGLTQQLKDVHKETKDFHKRVLREYNRVMRMSPELVPTGKLLSYLESSVFYSGNQAERGGGRLDMMMRNRPIGEWFVEVTYEYDAPVTLGSKLTDQGGGKGVITAIIPDDEMYRDVNGDLVDIIANDKATIGRMNLSRLFRQAANRAGRDYQIKLIRLLGDNPTPEALIAQWPELRQFHLAVMPDMVPFMDKVMVDDLAKAKFVKAYMVDGHYFYRPVESTQSAVDMLRNIRDLYTPTKERLSYVRDGEVKYTKNKIMTGSMYFYVLEQMAERWAAVASPKFHHHGVPAKISKGDRYRNAGHRNPTRTCGESEMRNYANLGIAPAMVELHDQSNNPISQREVVRNIQLCERPELLDQSICRKEFPLGMSRPLAFINHGLYVMGVGFSGGEDEDV